MKALGFDILGGSVIGRDHRDAGRNNQDSFLIEGNVDGIVAVVADGCSSSKSSEVGARIGVRLTASAIFRHWRRFVIRTPRSEIGSTSFPHWERVRQDVLAQLRTLAMGMGENFGEIVEEYLMFTLVGVFATPWETYFFSIGDGKLVVNGENVPIGPFEGNMPPYIGYGLVETSLSREHPELLRFLVHRRMPTAELSTFLLGTDGLDDFEASAQKLIPGQTRQVGPLSQFWLDNNLYGLFPRSHGQDGALEHNEDLVRRRLFLVGRDVGKIDPATRVHTIHHGLLSDDTTLIVGRRSPVEEL